MSVPYVLVDSNSSEDPRLLETIVPEKAESDLPEDCLIVAHWPTVLKSTTGLEVVDVSMFLKNSTYYLNQSECILFFEDYFCLDFVVEHYKDMCKEMHNNYELSETDV